MTKPSEIPNILGAFETDFESLEEALPFFLDWRARLEDMGRKRLALLLADGVSMLIDNAAVADLATADTLKVPDAPLSHVKSHIFQRRQAAQEGHLDDPETDFTFRISLHPHKEGLFGSLRCHHSAWGDAFLEGPHVERAPVWRALPGHPIHDILERRIRIWSEILARDPGQDLEKCGYTLDLTPSMANLAITEIVDAQRSFDVRLERAARHVFQSLFARPGLDAMAALQVMSRASEAAKTAGGRQWLASIKKACASRLAPHLDGAMFLGGDISIPEGIPEIGDEGRFRSR